jgi:hypothetical protein
MAEREATGIFDLIASRSSHQLRMGNSGTRPAARGDTQQQRSKTYCYGSIQFHLILSGYECENKKMAEKIALTSR